MPNPVSEIVGGVRVPDSGGQTRRVALPFNPDPCHRDVRQSVERRRRERRAAR